MLTSKKNFVYFDCFIFFVLNFIFLCFFFFFFSGRTHDFTQVSFWWKTYQRWWNTKAGNYPCFFLLKLHFPLLWKIRLKTRFFSCWNFFSTKNSIGCCNEMNFTFIKIYKKVKLMKLCRCYWNKGIKFNKTWILIFFTARDGERWCHRGIPRTNWRFLNHWSKQNIKNIKDILQIKKKKTS